MGKSILQALNSLQLFLILWLAASHDCIAQLKSRASVQFETATQKIKNQDYNDALELLTHAIKSDPDFCEAWLSRGVVYHQKKEFEKALFDYNRALVCYPGYPMAFYNRGISKLAQGDHYGALRDFSNALEKMQDHVPTLYNRSWTFLLLGDTAKSLIGLGQCIEKSPEYMPALLLQAVINRKQGEQDIALKQYSSILRRDSAVVIARFNRAHIYYLSGEYDKAREDFLKLSNDFPDDALIQLHTGALLSQSGNVKEACILWDRAAAAGSLEALQLIKRYCQ
jgi:tetratricopeptide (TPR) repeat protein